MAQSVDFLKVLSKPVNRITPLLMVLGVIIPTLVLVFFSIAFYMGYSTLQASTAKKREDLESIQAAYNDLVKKYPLLVGNMSLMNQVTALDEEYNNKLITFNNLEHLLVRPGFSGYMLGLAQKAPTSLWIDGIQVDHNAALIALMGYAQLPDSITELMSNLEATTGYGGVVFKSFYIKAVKNHSLVRFAISTKDISPPADELSGAIQLTPKVKE